MEAKHHLQEIIIIPPPPLNIAKSFTYFHGCAIARHPLVSGWMQGRHWRRQLLASGGRRSERWRRIPGAVLEANKVFEPFEQFRILKRILWIIESLINTITMGSRKKSLLFILQFFSIKSYHKITGAINHTRMINFYLITNKFNSKYKSYFNWYIIMIKWLKTNRKFQAFYSHKNKPNSNLSWLSFFWIKCHNWIFKTKENIIVEEFYHLHNVANEPRNTVTNGIKNIAFLRKIIYKRKKS